MALSINKILKTVIDYYYPLVMLINSLLMFNIDIRLGVIITFFSILYSIKSAFVKPTNRIISKLIIIYIIYNLISIVNYINNDIPLNIFFTELRNQIIPILFFFIGNNSKETDNKFYSGILLGSLYLFITGIILYFTMPSWYLTWKLTTLADWIPDVDQSFVSKYGLSSFFATSYHTGYLSIISISILLGQSLWKKINTYILLQFFVALIVLLLAQQRIAWLAFGFFFVIYSVYIYKNKHAKPNVFLIIVLAIILIIISVLNTNSQILSIYEILQSRFESIDSAVSERSSTWIISITSIFEMLFGHGFGMASHSAGQYGFIEIADGNFFKLFYEIGLIGISILIWIMTITLFRCVKNFKVLMPEFYITFFVSIACIGATPFSMPLIICIYWFCVGRIWNNKYILSNFKKFTPDKQLIVVSDNFLSNQFKGQNRHL